MSPQELEIWSNHFEYHTAHPRRLPPGLTDALSSEEFQLIVNSIATFQLGEQSEGRTLLRAADRFATARQLPHLVRIVDRLIREERRHAALLLRFMRDHGMPQKTHHWTDRAFRHIRRLAGLEWYLHVLISAELIGIVYYRALEAATDCERLQVLCRTLVGDQLAHVGFESQLLLSLQGVRAAPLRTLMRSAHRLFLVGTALVVWLTHDAVLRRAGLNARTFMRSCVAQYGFYLEPPRIAARSVLYASVSNSARVANATPPSTVRVAPTT